MNNKDHISVCICTYKRPDLLARLLRELQNQETDNLFTYSIVVVDNDCNQSAKATVSSIQKKSSPDIEYHVEKEQNIALARNKAVKSAKGNLIAFIDDDEFPVNNWISNLFKTLNDCQADGVLGPVKPYFEKEPPKWVVKGRLCERESHQTGLILKNHQDTRTGNVLLNKKLFQDKKNLFNPEFGRTGGEDVDFFKRMIKKGHKFVWCDEASVYELVPAERWKRIFMLRRAFLRGKVSFKSSSFNIFDIIKSVIAFPVYTLALPFIFFTGHHRFMKYLIKDCDHIGKLLAACGLNIIKERKS
ncbi:MAG: glycosyltransferase family 2 protein [Deltaproteobacteria bacterium]|nr:MAG: glycosyltransferase family 2 protein [Deltaproteobacteria bacterium]